ncbi:Coatomer subunit alpha-3 [Histomonas meleagridis]|uniref:Coatomer subunit alpha-3 n=1 Tax=Histomonas meleagridis TaxID=135588 RepID=UPI00355AA633|nr:Coatomer subunit alpha-3 [Histomonas meleagridis]KAH0797916.1 Coatomer subunit alpha-3 [Histomonas meleagridis]
MFVKLELETERVKGLCFHQSRPWLLVSFHNGEIVIYDYEVGVPLQKYNETDQSVRSVDFHPTLPLFCAGGDDNCVRVFDYEKQRCICTFTDHLDYVRTVQFHPTRPYIVSASDDQTIRIWNFETRSSVSVISGHNHYVMSAFFHPTQPLIISASLDDTVRVWDISAIFNSGQIGGLFSLTDAVLKFQQEEHVYGVNWAQWHPSRPLAISCSDDQTVKVWKLSDTEFSVIATLRSHHTSNVSCAIYHPTVDVIISCSEDKTVHLWDAKRFLHLAKYRRNDDRFWMLATHPTQPLFAAGHDTGFIVFRMMRQRPTFDVYADNIFYYKENAIRKYSYRNQSDGIVGITRPCPTGNRSTPLDPPPLRFSYSSVQNKLLVGHQNKFELHNLENSNGNSEQNVINGHDPIWISRSQFAYLGDSDSQLLVKELNGSSTTKIPIPQTKKIFSATNRNIFLVSNETVYLFDTMRRNIVATRSIPDIRFIYLSNDKKLVSFIGLYSITISTIDMNNVMTYYDGSRIKSGAWSDGFFIYSTNTHIKYLLPNGDNGIIRSLNERLYITFITDKQVICLNSNNEIRKIDIDLLECKFKLALSNNDMVKVKSILKNAKLCSESIIDFLQKRGHPEIAICFVNDPKTKFQLAINSGDLKTAAEEIQQNTNNDPNMWETLADEAMLHGNFVQAENAIKKSGNLERLSFFYLISGQLQKLNEMKCNETLSLQRSIWLNDRKNIFDIVKDINPTISYIAANNNEELLKKVNLDEEVKDKLKQNVNIKADLQSTNVNKDIEDWPLLNITQPIFDFTPNKNKSIIDQIDDDDDEGNGWGDDDIDNLLDNTNENNKNIDEAFDGGSNWDIDDDLNIDESILGSTNGNMFIPTNGEDIHDKWSANSNVPGEIIAAGYFGQALQTLNDQIALINSKPLKDLFIQTYLSSNGVIPTMASSPILTIPLSVMFGNGIAPISSFSLERFNLMVNNGKSLFYSGKFQESFDMFQSILHSIVVSICSTQNEFNEIKKIINVCRNYLIGLLLEINRKQNNDNPARQTELAAYFTHCKLDPIHLRLTLQSAMRIAFRFKYFNLSYEFASRLLELTPSPKVAEQAKKVVHASKAADAQKQQQPPKINYDSRNPFEICCKSLTPIYRGTQKVECPFCGACYKTEFKGCKCQICDLSKVGAKTSGLNLVRQRRDE